MAKDDKRSLTPKLRFPEFRGERGWLEKKLSNAIQLVSGLHLSPNQYASEGTHPYFTGPSDFTNEIDSITKWTSESTAIAEEDDTLITVKGSGVGEIWYLSLAAVAMGRQLMAVRTVDGSSRFIHHFLSTRSTRFEDLASGNLIPGLSRGDILDLVIPFPSPAEQQKIADCLTSLDDVIAAQGRKVEALKAHKKGLMQQLFPRDGETLPLLRFPEFRDAPEWNDKKLGDLVDIRSGDSPSQYQLSETGAYPFVKVEDLNNCVKYQTAAREYSDDTDGLIPRHSLIFPKRGAAIELNKIRLSARELLMDTNMMALTTSGEYRAEFLFYYLSHIGLSEIADSSTIPQINNKHIIPFEVVVPLPAEQKRIADCLSSLDARIAAEADKLAALKTHKKGLMQQLFPSPEGG